MSRVRVAVIGGGQNCEHDVSLASANSVAGALPGDVYDVVTLTIDRDGEWRDAAGRPLGLGGAVQVLTGCDVALPMVHGPRGEDGTLAALCEFAGVPYVGSGLDAGALGVNKWATKLVAGALGIRTASGSPLTPAEAAAFRWTGPVVVKPLGAGSSHGVTLVAGPDGLAAAFALDDRVLVEEEITGREIDIAVLGGPGGRRTVSPPLEIVVDGLFDHSTKYGGQADFCVPAVLTGAERASVERAALAMYDALGCRGVARVDFFLTPSGPVLNEVNTVPGFTSESQVPRMFSAVGLSYPDLLDRLVRDALGSPEFSGPAMPVLR